MGEAGKDRGGLEGRGIVWEGEIVEDDVEGTGRTGA